MGQCALNTDSEDSGIPGATGERSVDRTLFRIEEKNEQHSCGEKAYDGIYNRVIKRIMDIVISGVALCIIWPIYLLIGILIVVDDGFPVL